MKANIKKLTELINAGEKLPHEWWFAFELASNDIKLPITEEDFADRLAVGTAIAAYFSLSMVLEDRGKMFLAISETLKGSGLESRRGFFTAARLTLWSKPGEQNINEIFARDSDWAPADLNQPFDIRAFLTGLKISNFESEMRKCFLSFAGLHYMQNEDKHIAIAALMFGDL